ncbi:MAG: methyltransferase domain-containing protein [Dehalococcoidia bacterium]
MLRPTPISLWDALRGAEVPTQPGGAARPARRRRGGPDGNLRDLRLLNRTLGWSTVVGREVDRVMHARDLRRATLLDIATGSGDIPRYLVRPRRYSRPEPGGLASDLSAAVLAEARSVAAGEDLPFLRPTPQRCRSATAPFDIITCCLAAHHLEPAALTRALAEMRRVARHAVIVSDLVRGRFAYVARTADGAVALRNRLTAHDAPVSVLRAYTPAEIAALARAAGLRRVIVRRARFPRPRRSWTPT